MIWRDLAKKRKDFITKLREKSPWEILGVSNSASRSEIRKAYRELALVYHPDRSHAFLKSYNQEIMKIINEAYSQIIGDK
ncbi:MAG TPA: J domain-containing protein [Candidatus Omnitrophota bacterium]|nr:J domain-containing protein [Candidatus Omnitrophota bacterium]